MLVLILDRSHGVLVEDDRIPEVPFAGTRPLRTVHTTYAARGLPLRSPVGSRAALDGGRDFAFLIDRVDPPPGMTWRPLREFAADETISGLYSELLLGGYHPPTRAFDVWCFGDTPEMAAKLVHLVVCGTKRVTMSWVDAAERDGTPLARVGGVSIVTDGFGYPRLCLRYHTVDVKRFGDVTAADAAGEGEGDLTYDNWREDHIAFFSREAAALGLRFDDDARIAVERFEVLKVIGAV